MNGERLFLFGENAGAWLPFARSRVARLKELSDRSGVRNLKQRFQPDAETEVWAEIRNGERHITIRTGGCPAYLNGLLNLREYPPNILIGVPNDPNGSFGAAYFYERAEDVPVGSAPMWVVEPGLSVSALQVPVYRPTMFSGAMRRVVQLLYGENKTHTYSPLWSTTHGCYIAGDGTPWVVEVSASGLFVWPMNYCTRAKDSRNTLGFVPLPTNRPSSPTKLLDSSTLSVFYNKGSFFPACGWAFNSKGTRAANTAVAKEGIWWRSWLYEIQITEEDSKPVSASLNELESGWIHGPKLEAQLKFPNGGNTQLESFDTYGGNANYVKVCDSPVFAFYENDALLIARYKHDPTYTTSTPVDEFPPYIYESSVPGKQFWKGTETTRKAAIVYVDTYSPPETRRSLSGTMREYGTFEPLGWDYDEPGPEYYTGSGSKEVGKIRLSTVTQSQSESVSSALVVPLYEREACYVAWRASISDSGGAESEEYHPASRGPVYEAVWVEACKAPVSHDAVAIKITSTIRWGAPVQNGQTVIVTYPSVTWIDGLQPGASMQIRNQYNLPDYPTCEYLPGVVKAFGYTKVEKARPASSAVQEERLVFIAPGDRVELTLGTNTQLFTYIDGLADQVMLATVEPFGLGKIYSPEINKINGPDLISDIATYPVSDIVGIFSFIGVP